MVVSHCTNQVITPQCKGIVVSNARSRIRVASKIRLVQLILLARGFLPNNAACIGCAD